METLPAAAPDESTGTNSSSVKSDDSSPQPEGGGRGSPPPNCAICLGACRNKSFTDSCLHQFCFKCLFTWSKVKAECPLCKQNFRSIIHNVRSNQQYEEYMVEQRHTEETIERIDIDNFATATRRFRYRTTLTLPRRDTIAIQQLLVHYPIMADVFPARAPPARRRRSPAAFRRTVYRHNLWARPLPDFTGRYRDCTPEFYRYNDTQMHRLVPWINRELHYLLNENIGHISYVLTRILELLPQYHINSPEFRAAMQRFFGDRTEHFLHELYCFASTPYDMTGYDRNVQYTTDTRISTMVNEVISSSESEASVDSDIVMVSSSEPAEPPPGPSRVPAPVYPQNYIPQPPVDNVIPIETISHSDTDDDSSEVMVVGYIKPPQDRTPEVVDLLGSDSDVIVQENIFENMEHLEPTVGPNGTIDSTTAKLNAVKLSIKRKIARERGIQWDSDSSQPGPPRRRRRARSNATATTSDTCRSTPSPFFSARPWETQPSSSTYTPSSSFSYSPSSAPTSAITTSTTSTNPSDTVSDTSTISKSSNDRKKRLTKKKSKRKRKDNTRVEKNKRKYAKRSKSRSKNGAKRTRSTSDGERDRRSKRKSHSGKGVKSSKKSDSATNTSPQQAVDALEQPSTSGTSSSRNRENDRKRRRTSRENRKLRSVVNVMYSQKNSGDSDTNTNVDVVNDTDDRNGIIGTSDNNVEDNRTRRSNDVPTESLEGSSSKAETDDVRVDADDTDSEDNLPLNLTVQKTYPSSAL